jgi:hypothetical protein
MFGPRDYIDGFPTYRLEGHIPVPCDEEDERWDDCHSTKVGLHKFATVRISTVFLGTDRRGEDTAREGFVEQIATTMTLVGLGPLLFETLVFVDGKNCAAEGFRYSTWEEAALGHLACVERWQNSIPRSATEVH